MNISLTVTKSPSSQAELICIPLTHTVSGCVSLFISLWPDHSQMAQPLFCSSSFTERSAKEHVCNHYTNGLIVFQGRKPQWIYIVYKHSVKTTQHMQTDIPCHRHVQIHMHKHIHARKCTQLSTMSRANTEVMGGFLQCKAILLPRKVWSHLEVPAKSLSRSKPLTGIKLLAYLQISTVTQELLC